VTELTIDELAREAGTTSRNVRAYQERGLLPPPRLKGRTGYYGDGHVARLRHIATLLERGFSLAAIRELFDAWERGYGLSDVLGFEEALAAPWGEEESSFVTLEQLADLFGDDARALSQAVRIGLLWPEEEGFRVSSPRLLETARRLTAAGIPVRTLLAEAGHLMADLDQMAERWVSVFKESIWDDSVGRGMPAADLKAMTSFLQGMREMVGDIIAPLLAQAMERRLDAMAADTLSASPPKATTPKTAKTARSKAAKTKTSTASSRTRTAGRR